MNLEELWKSMGTEEETLNTLDFFNPKGDELKKTVSPLYKIKKSLEMGMIWITLIFLLYVAGAVFFKPFITKLSLIILAGYCIYSFLFSLKLRNQIGPVIIADNALKAEVERHYQNIMQWCKSQERNAIFLYPVSILGGAVLGLSVDGLEKMNHILQKPVVWLLLAGITIVLVPLLYLLTRRMMKIAYYSHLEHLKQVIHLLEE